MNRSMARGRSAFTSRQPDRRLDRWALPGRRLTAALLPDDLDADLTLTGSVEFGKDDRLELAQRDLAVEHTHRHAPAEQGRTEVRVGIPAMAVRDARIVVPVVASLGHQSLGQGLEVGDEGVLELVDEERTGRVKRVDPRHARKDLGLSDGVP